MELETIVSTFSGAEDAVDAKLDEIADFILANASENLIKNKTSDTGFLLRSGDIIRKPFEKTIIFHAPHAAFIEYGTEPHFPPIEPLQKWAQKKLHLNEVEARSAAFAIANKINQEGTEPQPFFRPAIDAARAKYGGF